MDERRRGMSSWSGGWLGQRGEPSSSPSASSSASASVWETRALRAHLASSRLPSEDRPRAPWWTGNYWRRSGRAGQARRSRARAETVRRDARQGIPAGQCEIARALTGESRGAEARSDGALRGAANPSASRMPYRLSRDGRAFAGQRLGNSVTERPARAARAPGRGSVSSAGALGPGLAGGKELGLAGAQPEAISTTCGE